MTTQEVKRKLTAILSADAKGYSRLMAMDEKETVHTLNAYKEVMTGLIQHHHGRVVDAPGDNLLAEFSSVVDAVECAVEIQKELKTRNVELPENRRMEFRIGVNLGDVIEEGERIYGDGVNIAARLESLSDAGGTCISGTAFDQVKNKLSVGYQYLGKQTVKNIPDRVRAYKVLMGAEAVGKVIGEKEPKDARWGWKAAAAVVALALVAGGLVWNFYLRATRIEPASEEKMAPPLPDKPSIAVLPFTNMSNDPKQEYLADGISENIINALSQVPYLWVIARNSTFTYKAKPVKIQQVAGELGVRYVLEGSVQSSADTLRITAQLIDAVTGHHVWSERYDRKPKDIFALQDDITMKVITSLGVKLTDGEYARLVSRGTENLQAYLKCLQAKEFIDTHTKEGYAQARALIQEAISLDSQYPVLYNLLGVIHFSEVSRGLSKSPGESLKQARELFKKVITLDNSYANPHSFLGWIYVLLKRQYDQAITECEQGIALAPGSFHAHFWMGVVLMYSGRHEEAIRSFEKVVRLDPIPSGWVYRNFGTAYFHAGRHEEAVAALKKSLNCAPNDFLTHAALATTYSWADRHEEARKHAAEVLRIKPDFFVEERAKVSPYKNRADLDKYVGGLRKAGLK